MLAAADAEVTVSLDGVAAAQSFRDGGGAARVEEALRLASGAEGEWFARRVGARITLHSGNVRFLSASVELLLLLGLGRVEVAPVVSPDPAWNAEAAEALDGELGRLAAALPVPAPAANPIFRSFGALVRDGTGRGPLCGIGSPDALFLDVDGSVAPCGAMVPSFLHDPPPLVRDAVATLGGPKVTDTGLKKEMRARAGRAATLRFARDLVRKRSPRGSCASCPALGECFVCPASIAFAPEQDSDLVPAIQCDWSRLVSKHRRAFLARAARETRA